MMLGSNSDAWLVIVDHQRVFIDGTSPWATPGYEQTVPVVTELAARHAGRIIATRWIPAHGEQRIGSWVDYYEQWPFVDRPVDDEIFDLVPGVARLRPNHVLSTHTFGKWNAEMEAITGPAPHLVVVGITTDCCVLNTALGAAEAGARVSVVADGCAGSNLQNHRRSLDVMGLFGPQIRIDH